MDNGWISIHRKIKAHWLYTEKRVFSNLEAWMDILLTVNHSDKKVLIGGVLFDVKRGDSIMSLDSWAKRWNWNKSKVRRFLSLLENDKMIITKNEIKTTRLTVLHYNSYQTTGNADETQVKHKRNASETQATPNNNDNNVNNENNENKKEIQFDLFWNLYDKKQGRENCLKNFCRLSDEDINKILLVVKDYVILTPETKYRKMPLTWLNGKHWNDELKNNKTLNYKPAKPTF